MWSYCTNNKGINIFFTNGYGHLHEGKYISFNFIVIFRSFSRSLTVNTGGGYDTTLGIEVWVCNIQGYPWGGKGACFVK